MRIYFIIIDLFIYLFIYLFFNKDKLQCAPSGSVVPPA